MLVNYIGDSVLKVNIEGEVFYIFFSWLDNYGYIFEEIDGYCLFLFLYLEDIEKIIFVLEVLKVGEVQSFFELEYCFKYWNGVWFWVEIKGELEFCFGEIVLISWEIIECKILEQWLQSLIQM